MVPIKHWNRKTSVKHTAFAQVQRPILLIKVIFKPLQIKIRIILHNFRGPSVLRQKFDFKGFLEIFETTQTTKITKILNMLETN